MPARFRPAVALAVWTLLVWTTRIRNIWTDADLSTIGQVGRSALAMSFTILAVGVVQSTVRSRGGPLVAGVSLWVRTLALWTTAVWAVRGVQIMLADHEPAFVVVHTVLAVVSVGLAWLADRRIRAVGASEMNPPQAAPSSVTPPHMGAGRPNR